MTACAGIPPTFRKQLVAPWLDPQERLRLDEGQLRPHVQINKVFGLHSAYTRVSPIAAATVETVPEEQHRLRGHRVHVNRELVNRPSPANVLASCCVKKRDNCSATAASQNHEGL